MPKLTKCLHILAKRKTSNHRPRKGLRRPVAARAHLHLQVPATALHRRLAVTPIATRHHHLPAILTAAIQINKDKHLFYDKRVYSQCIFAIVEKENVTDYFL